jgi:hypothetical protein
MGRLLAPFRTLGVRTVAVLMLLAGLSLGVFAARALWAERPRPVAPAGLDEAIENKVRLYVEYYRLDPAATDSVRRCLQEHDRAVGELYRRLRQDNAKAFEALRTATEATLNEALRDAVLRRTGSSPSTPK